MKRISISLILFFVAFNAKAGRHEDYQNYLLLNAPHSEDLAKPRPPISFTDKAYNKRIKEQEKKRRIAAVDEKGINLDAAYYESEVMSEQFKKFRDIFLKITSAQELDEKLAELDAQYDSIPDSAMDLKFIAAQLIPFRAFRGIVWRLIDPVDTSPITHSVVLTQVKNFAVSTKIFFPTAQWQAGIDYLTQPFVQDGKNPWKPENKGKIITPFPKDVKWVEAPIQAYFINTIIPMVETAALRISQLDLSKKEKGWVFDNRLWYGTGSFPDARDRFAYMGEGERLTALTNLYAGLSEAYYQASYSWNGTLALNKELGKLYGFDHVLSAVDGVPAEKRVPIIKAKTDWGLWFAKDDYSQKKMDQSWTHLVNAVTTGEKAWEVMNGRPASTMNMIDNSSLLTFQRPIKMRFDNMKAMIAGEKVVNSFITNEPVTVNLRAWYSNPTRDLKNLYGDFTARRPIDRKTGREVEPNVEFIENAVVKTSMGTFKLPKYRNYLKGRPYAWNLTEYRKLLPDVKTDEDVIKYTRILSQSWGGGLIAFPLNGYIN